jgi:hypothetical protein
LIPSSDLRVNPAVVQRTRKGGQEIAPALQGAKYMGSFRPQGGSFQSEDIAVLQKVFDDVWSTIVTHRPTQAENDDLKTMVSEKLCAIAASGVMDPEQLRSRTLASFELSRPHE